LLRLLAACLAWSAASEPALKAGPDARIELLGVVQALAGLRDERQPWPEGLADFVKEFEPWRGHEVVALYQGIFRRSRGSDPMGLVLLAMGEVPGLAWARPKADISPDFIQKTGGEAELERFLGALRDFSKASGYAERYARRRAYYEEMATSAEAEIAGEDFVATVESYVGRPLNARMRFVTTAAYTPSRLNCYIFPYPYRQDGRRAVGPFMVYTIMPLERDSFGKPRYGLNEPFNHGYMNELFYLIVEPAYRRHREDFEIRAAAAQRHLKGCMPIWQNCSGILIVQALVARVMKTRYQREPAPEPGPMGRCVGELEKTLEKYESFRASGKVKGLPDYYPRLIKTFDSPACRGEGR
jgi:hypothetical protein